MDWRDKPTVDIKYPESDCVEYTEGVDDGGVDDEAFVDGGDKVC